MTSTNVKTAQSNIDLCWNMVLVLSVITIANILPDAAFATSGSNAIQTVFCNVVNLLTGTTGKAIATVAVIAVGIGALLGKISWGMALIVAVGVALVFGASSIVDALGAAGGSCTLGGQQIP